VEETWAIIESYNWPCTNVFLDLKSRITETGNITEALLSQVVYMEHLEKAREHLASKPETVRWGTDTDWSSLNYRS